MYISSFNTYFLSIKSDAITFCCYLVCQSVHQHCTHLPSQPAQQSDIGYDVITGAESVFQSDRLYYDKVDARCVINDNQNFLKTLPK